MRDNCVFFIFAKQHSVIHHIMKQTKLISKTRKVIMITAAIITGVFLIIFTGSYLTQRIVKTPIFKDEQGNRLTNSIAEFCRIPINGDKHALLIRGKSLDNPILLFLHAGPSLSETGLMRNFNPELEEHYTMVYYEMRGSAKSFSLFQNYIKTFTTEQLLDDIHKVTQYLKTRFKKDKIAILGHSFGAGFGALTAATYPDDYSCFISVGVGANPTKMNKLSYAWTLKMAHEEKNEKAIAELKQLDQYWLLKNRKEYIPKMIKHKKWVGYYDGQLIGQNGFMGFVIKNMRCKEYGIFDYFPFYLGMMKCANASFDIMVSTDLCKQASNINTPVVFIAGKKDFNAVPEMIEEFYEAIKSPSKKIYWFENSAHFPHIEENKKFQDIMINEVLPIIK